MKQAKKQADAKSEMAKLTNDVKVDFTRAKFALEKFKRQLAHLPRGKNAK